VLCAVLALLTALPAYAGLCAAPLPTPSAELVAKAQQQARNRGFLWRISKKGHVSYLYGTLHIGKLEWMFPGAAVLNALQASDSVALELNVRDPALMQQLQAGVAASTAAPLEADLQKRLERQAELNCVGVASLRALRPEMQISALSVAAARMLGLETSYGVEMVLASYASNSHKTIDSLESVSEQLQSFLVSNGDEMRELVASGLDDLESGNTLQLLGTLSAAWASSDFQKLNNYSQWCNCIDTPQDRAALKRLLDDRNPNLALRLDAMHDSGRKVFAAVGALHMIGANGLPERMRRMGYQVQRIF
jgi:uncharacterized protein YbaP (TraB family)